MDLEEKTTPLLLFSGPRNGLRNHQKIKEPENNNFSVVFFSDPLIKVIFLELFFITYLTFFSECWCNGLLTCVSFTYHTNIFVVKIHFNIQSVKKKWYSQEKII